MPLTLEKGMSIMGNDEYLEITPHSVRLRKQFLTEQERVRMGRKK
jgi:GTP-binding protein